MTTTPEEADAPVQFVFTSDGVVRREDRPPSDCASPSPKGMDLFMPDILKGKTSLPFSPGVAFTEEERKRVQQLVGLDQTILISFNDLEEEVAVKVVIGNLFAHYLILTQVLNEMYEKAVSFETMDYQLVFWGYTFAIKKLTWFAQVKEPTTSCNHSFESHHQAINEFSTCDVEDKKELLLQNLDPMFNIKSAFFFLR